MRPFLHVLTAALTLLAGSAAADVLATVDDADLTWMEVVMMIGGEENAPYLGITSTADASEVLESWVREEVMVRAAVASGLESDPDIAFLIDQATRQILLDAYMGELVSDVHVSQLEKENYVDEWFETYTITIHARHIIVDSAVLANSILAMARGGSDFQDLAREYSMGPSGENGGDLGWITRGQSGYMEFDEAAFTLPVGGISSVVETGAGFHIIQVVEIEDLSPAPTVGDINEFVGMELDQILQEEVILEKVEQLRATHSVQLFPDRLLQHLN